ncbi:calcium-binding protein [Pseudanabaena sp. PCC 6802]|uniref:calcium-binding protein n=1 Tax=Pseudanabaena sp. PCC 6802 TaxID=118173 RepID=UPI00034B61C2|nr:calcium-binding protein [Pseudanabaena sp. PCC 6802]
MAVILGTPFSDLLFGTDVDDLVRGFEGDDFAFGQAGDDVIQGNPGIDVLYGNIGNDTLYGGFSNDLLFGGKGSDVLFGDRGDDTLLGNRGADFLQGGEGSDLFVIGPGTGGSSFQEADIISDFRNGEDLIGLADGLNFRDLNIVAGVADNIGNTIIENNFTGEILAILQGVNRGDIGSGNFTTFLPPSFNPALPTVNVAATDASATEGVFEDGVFTFTRTNTSGNLTVNYVVSGTALNGTDYLNIPNAVTIPEGQSSATVKISAFDEGIAEPNETAVIDISPSVAYNVGSPSNATVTIIDAGGGGGGGGGGPSTVPTAGADLLTGTTNADNIDGLAGNDTIRGLEGADTLLGNDDNDILQGGDGNDALTGGNGADTITGNVGADSLTGGAGVDRFFYNAPGDGGDTIADFALGEDLIFVSATGFSGGLVAGALPGTAFASGAGLVTAANADIRFIYDTTGGVLNFDADGNAAVSSPVQIATLTGNPLITAASIQVF